MTTRDEVLEEFPHQDLHIGGPRIHRLADEIVRLRTILDNLREADPDFVGRILDEAFRNWRGGIAGPAPEVIIKTAIVVAEREV